MTVFSANFRPRPMTLAPLLILVLASTPVFAEQFSYFKELRNSGWHYRIGFRDSQDREHIAYFDLSKFDIEKSKTVLQSPEDIFKTIREIGEDNRRDSEKILSRYADELWDDVLKRTYHHADNLMLALPSGSRIHISFLPNGQYKFEGHTARDYRFWKFDDYNRIMAQAVDDLQTYFKMQIAERDRAIKIYRNDLERQLQARINETGTQLMNNGLLVVNEYDSLQIDYRATVRKSLWHLRGLSLALDSIDSDRNRVDKVLGFFQSIPYEAISDDRHESATLGFRMPAVTIEQNLGDCDSKAIGAAAVLKNLMPSRRILMVLVPGHAFLAMQLNPEPGDDIVHLDGSQWVLLEPVGPQLSGPGKVAPESLQKLREGINISYVEL